MSPLPPIAARGAQAHRRPGRDAVALVLHSRVRDFGRPWRSLGTDLLPAPSASRAVREGRGAPMKEHHYRDLLIMAVLSFVSMYVLMYAMVDRFGHMYSNVNQVYMAGLMT